jgi:hypothetical protein
MSDSTNRQQLLELIQASWEEHDQERSINNATDDKNIENISYGDWVKLQTKLVQKLSNEDVNTALRLFSMIRNGNKVKLVDKEHMIRWEASGLYIDDDGSFVIFHER